MTPFPCAVQILFLPGDKVLQGNPASLTGTGQVRPSQNCQNLCSHHQDWCQLLHTRILQDTD